MGVVSWLSEKIIKFLSLRSVSFVIIGLIMAVFGYGVFVLLLWLGVEYVIGNAVSSISVKVIIFFLHKRFVFKTKCDTFGGAVAEFGKFAVARSFSFVLEMVLIVVFVELLRIPPDVSKIILMAVIISVNYVFSVFFVFRKIGVKGKADSGRGGDGVIGGE